MGETENGGDELERYTVEGETGDYEFFFLINQTSSLKITLNNKRRLIGPC